jgi:uncharacterized integral membrane protein
VAEKPSGTVICLSIADVSGSKEQAREVFRDAVVQLFVLVVQTILILIVIIFIFVTRDSFC